MRILDLTLEKYGPFTGETLSFRPDARVHVVLGPNEAGKSCALAAITDLFYRIEPRTKYDFLHKAKDLRMRATIQAASSGAALNFQRRRGNKDTLLDLSDKTLPDDALLPFIGNLTREVFCRAFGLNSETLRQGAEEMLQAGGEIGATLFAAASGLRGLLELRDELEEQADKIFASRAAKDRRFYQILERYETARRSIRDLELKVSDWKNLNQHIEELNEKLRNHEMARAANKSEQARLGRLRRVAPIFSLVDADVAELRSIGPVPDLTVDFAERLRVAIEAYDEAALESERSLREQVRAEDELSNIEVDTALLASGAEIQDLFGKTGAYENAQRDMPRVQAEGDAYSAELGELARRMGLTDPAEMVSKQPPDIVCARVVTLISKGKDLQSKLEIARVNLDTELENIADLKLQLASRKNAQNPKELRSELAMFAPALKRLERLKELRLKIAAEENSIVANSARLIPPVSDLLSLFRSPLPSSETVNRFRIETDRIAADARRVDEQVRELQLNITSIERGIAQLSANGVVPSRDQILAERGARDTAWGTVRGSIAGKAPALSGGVLTDTIVSFERHNLEADRLADEALANADAVARLTSESARLSEEKQKLADALDRRSKISLEADSNQNAWRTAWEPSGVAPLPPVEMAQWLSQIQTLLQRRDKSQSDVAETANIAEELVNVRVPLEDLARKAGVTAGKNADLSDIAVQIESELSGIEEAWDVAKKLETKLHESEARARKFDNQQSEVRAKVAEWEKIWVDALTPLGLPSSTTIQEVEAALTIWQEVPGIVQERESRRRRVEGMKRDIHAFENHAIKLLEAFASDLLSLPPDKAIKALNERLSTIKASEARRQQASKRVESAKQGVEEAAASLRDVDDKLKQLTSSLPADTDLADFLHRFERHCKADASLAEHRNQLLAQGDGLSEEELRAELSGFDPDNAEAKIQQLVRENQRFESEEREAFADRKAEIQRRDGLYKGVGAELANQQKKNAEAELLLTSREWLIQKSGALLISHAIEKIRSNQNNPLITRAGELFRTITGNSFAGVGQEFGDDDTLHLVGVRPSNDTVAVSALSEGSRDQLYLALRLAYLEDFASKAEAAPFIGDDIFTTFDDERTGYALKALAAIGDKVQPIVFTHHRHVADIAKSVLNQSADVIYMSDLKTVSFAAASGRL